MCLLEARGMTGASGETWWIIRRARAAASILSGMTPVIIPDELVAGRLCRRKLTKAEKKELDAWRKVAPHMPPVHGQRAHQTVDIEKLLREGVSGIRDEIGNYRAALDLSVPADMEKDTFYRACLITLDGFSKLAANYRAKAAGLASAAGSGIAAERYRELAEIFAQVPDLPARNFREALQATWLLTFALCAGQMMLLFQTGRPDRYLWPYYQRDVAEGRINRKQAQELIDAFCLQFNDLTPRGLAVGFMLSGEDGYGNEVSNELTHLFLNSIEHVGMAYPGIGICWSDRTPEDVVQKGCRLLSRGFTHPAFFNDGVISKGMRAAGLTEHESRLYINSTCVEITPIASSNVYVASPYINLPQCLNDVLGVPLSGSENASVNEQPSDFNELKSLCRARLAEIIRNSAIDQNAAMMTRDRHGGFPFQSCFVNDCLARGRDIDYGGARHNWIEPSFVGLANLADSLAAVKRFVFEEKTVSLAALADALRSNFKGNEQLRQMFLKGAPKYGNDDPSVDDLAGEVTDWIVEECRKYRTWLGGRYHPGLFCWIMHERLGSATAATADGRRAGFPLADGCGPAQGRELHGPTAAARSVTSWEHSPMLGGMALNLKFGKSSIRGRELSDIIFDVVQSYMRLGGFQVQVNVVDRETLLKAREKPEEYRDLVVRIGGYSDYFVNLPEGMQEEVIARTEHE